MNQKNKIHTTLYDYKDYSNGGRYNYERKGLLSRIPSIKLNRGVFIIKLDHKKEVLSVLKKNKANLRTILIEIPESLLKES